MKPEFLAKLAKLGNVSCIKESTGDLTRITAIRLLTKDQVTLIAGWESSSLQAFMAGASGWAPVCTNFVPGDAMRFFSAAVQKRDASAAQTIWDKLFPVCDFICAKSHIRVAHTGLDILGRPVGPPRRPLSMRNGRRGGPTGRPRMSRPVCATRMGDFAQMKSQTGNSLSQMVCAADASRFCTAAEKNRIASPGTKFVQTGAHPLAPAMKA